MAPHVSSIGTPVVVGPVQLVEVDHVDAEARRARPRSLRGPPRGGTRSPRAAGRHLRRDDDLVAAPGDRPADERLRDPVAVDLGGVDPVDAGVERRRASRRSRPRRTRSGPSSCRRPPTRRSRSRQCPVRSIPAVVLMGLNLAAGARRHPAPGPLGAETLRSASALTARTPRRSRSQAGAHDVRRRHDQDRRREGTRRRPVRRGLRRRHAAHGRPVHLRHRGARERPRDPSRTSRPRSGPRPAPCTGSRRSRSSSPRRDITTPGDHADVLVAMNPAALKADLDTVEPRRHRHPQRGRVHPAQHREGGVRRRPDVRRHARRLPGLQGAHDLDHGARHRGHRHRQEGSRTREEHVRARARLVDVRPAHRDHAELARAEVRRQAGDLRRERRGVQGRLQLRRDHRAVRALVQGGGRAGRAGHLPQHRGLHRPVVGAGRGRRSAAGCRCSTRATRSRRPPSCCTSSHGTRTSA